MTASQFRTLESVNNSDISRVWDELAPTRYKEISSGRDRSYTQTLLPIIEEFSKRCSGGNLIDAGCGVGFAAKSASKFFSRVDAIDLSEASISIALEKNSSYNVKYTVSSLEEFSPHKGQYDALISSMVLMDCPDYKSYIRACYNLIAPAGRVILTFCHPIFWPRYWGFEKCAWFNYNADLAIESHFRTSSTGVSPSKTIYFHRPLHCYMNELSNLGFKNIQTREISGISVKSRILNKYPRYLVVEAEK